MAFLGLGMGGSVMGMHLAVESMVFFNRILLFKVEKNRLECLMRAPIDFTELLCQHMGRKMLVI